MVYTCKVELNNIAPKIWREFRFHPEVTFHQLHLMIQTVMGWENAHLYEFHVNGQVIGLVDPEYEAIEKNKVQNARRELVGKHLQQVRTTFTYIYDFGDYWEHTIELVQIDSSMSAPVPACLGGARNCPYEDIGGVAGHQYMLEVLFTPNHPDREQLDSWGGQAYDPEFFSCEEVNRKLQKLQVKLTPKTLIQRQENKKPVKLTKSVLNKHLKQLNNDQLIDLVKACFSASKEMEKFLALKILGDEAIDSLFQEYCKKVKQAFFPDRRHGKLKLQEAEQAITEFERWTGRARHSLELKLIYVENGVDFTLSYGDIDQRFYYNVASMYAEIIEAVNEDDTGELFEEFEQRLDAIVSNTEGIGWGFHDELADLHAGLRWI